MSGELIAVCGPNFSGRSARLAAEAGLYLGPDPSSFFSGIASAVREEVALGGQGSAEGALGDFGLEALAARNPFALSGGEQTLVALAAIGLSGAAEANLDCCLEQLDPERRSGALRALRARVPRLRVADNALGEWVQQCSSRVDLERPAGAAAPPRIEPAAARGRPHTAPCRLGARALGFGYGRERAVLQGVDLELAPGRVCLLEGANGAGKSTLSRLLAGLLRPRSGAVELDGVAVPMWRRPGSAVAYHHQYPDVQLFADSVREELRSSTGSDAASAWAAAALGLEPFLARHPLDLPFVLRKRVALAAALARPCPWYVLDEPNLGQDAESAHAIAQILAALAESGAGVIAISHSSAFKAHLPEARRLRLESGQLLELG